MTEAPGRPARRPVELHAGSNFRVAFRVLPPARRRAIESIYRFCRRADDAVDAAEHVGAARERLEEVRRELDEVYGGRPSNPALARLASVVVAFDLPRKPFDDLIEGVSWDLEGRRYATTDDLRAYCIRVASTVGLLCVRIFGCRHASCDRFAEELGVALQWTNILRDVGVDLARGRIYLPTDAMRRHHLEDDDLHSRDPVTRARVTELIREQAVYAHRCYAIAASALPEPERPRVLAAEIMANVYRELLRKIERAGCGVLDRELRVGAVHRVWLALRTTARARLRVAAVSGPAT